MAPAVLSARQVAAYDDAQLDEFLDQLCRSCQGGPLVLDFDDPGVLPSTFFQRLRDWVSTHSQALDLAALDDRLLAIQCEQSPTPPVPSDEEIEVHNYNQLVAEGACPVYSVDLVGKVTQNPAEYHEMLSPWIIGNDYMVFRNQLLRWQEFRQWQRYNREDFEPWGKPTSSVEVELAYNKFTRYRRKFIDYTAAIRDLLRPCIGVQDHVYTFCDVDQQDRLTTWIEYLGYEYWRFPGIPI